MVSSQLWPRGLMWSCVGFAAKLILPQRSKADSSVTSIRKDLVHRLKVGVCLQTHPAPPPPPLFLFLFLFTGDLYHSTLISYHMTSISRFTSKVTVKLALIGGMVALFNLPGVSFDFGINLQILWPARLQQNVGSKVRRWSFQWNRSL